MHHTALQTLIPAIIAALQEEQLPTPAPAPVTPAPKGLVDGKVWCAWFGASASTRDRSTRDGMPHTYVGAHRRYDLDACSKWFLARGKKRAAPAGEMDPEVRRLARASGLRIAGGAK